MEGPVVGTGHRRGQGGKGRGWASWEGGRCVTFRPDTLEATFGPEVVKKREVRCVSTTFKAYG